MLENKMNTKRTLKKECEKAARQYPAGTRFDWDGKTRKLIRLSPYDPYYGSASYEVVTVKKP
jgi:hypothetical protein